MISKVLTKKGATVWSLGMLYKVMAQMVLLCGSEIWVVTGDMLKLLEGFHNWAARRITGMTACNTEDGELE